MRNYQILQRSRLVLNMPKIGKFINHNIINLKYYWSYLCLAVFKVYQVLKQVLNIGISMINLFESNPLHWHNTWNVQVNKRQNPAVAKVFTPINSYIFPREANSHLLQQLWVSLLCFVNPSEIIQTSENWNYHASNNIQQSPNLLKSEILQREHPHNNLQNKKELSILCMLNYNPQKIKIQAYLRKLSKTDQSRAHVSDLHAPNPHAITKCRSSPLLMAVSNSARLGIKKNKILSLASAHLNLVLPM